MARPSCQGTLYDLTLLLPRCLYLSFSSCRWALENSAIASLNYPFTNTYYNQYNLGHLQNIQIAF